MSGLQVYINGVLLNVEVTQARLVDGLLARSDSATVSAVVGRDDTFPNILAGNSIDIYVNGEKRFGGTVLSRTVRLSTPGAVVYTITAADYTWLLNRRLVVKGSYPQQTAGDRIKAILNDFAPTFAVDTSHIQDGFAVSERSYNYQSISSVLDELAGAIGYHWYIDQFGAVHFMPAESFTSPLHNCCNDLLTFDNPYIGNISITEDATVYNVITLKDFGVKSSNKWTDHFKSDGAQTFYKLGMEPFDTDVDVEVQDPDTGVWTPRTVKKDPLDGSEQSLQGLPGDAYVCIYNGGVRFPESDIPPDGAPIRASYHYVIPYHVRNIIDFDSIREMTRREGSQAYHQMVASIPDFRVDTEDPIKAYGQLLLAQNAWPIYSGSFKSIQLSGWRAWQQFKIYDEDAQIWDWQSYVKTDYTNPQPLSVTVSNVTTKFIPNADGSVTEDCSVQFVSVIKR